MMYVNLISSKLPSEKQFKQIFGELEFDDWLNTQKNDNITFVYDILHNYHKRWQYL